jgi:hypothetical protein
MVIKLFVKTGTVLPPHVAFTQTMGKMLMLHIIYVNVRIIIRLPNTMRVFMNLNTF